MAFPVLSSVCAMCLGIQIRNTDACHWQVDLCPACYEEKGSKYKIAQRCVDGLEVGTPTSTKKASNVGKKKASGERLCRTYVRDEVVLACEYLIYALAIMIGCMLKVSTRETDGHKRK